MIDARKGVEKKEERYDLFSSLLDANEEESDSAAKLSDDELMGNIFIHLVAGHEVGPAWLLFCVVSTQAGGHCVDYGKYHRLCVRHARPVSR